MTSLQSLLQRNKIKHITTEHKAHNLPTLPLKHISLNHVISYNLHYDWSFGSLAGIFFSFQIITGFFLTMHYIPNIDCVFNSINIMMREINYEWIIRFMNVNGASLFFLMLYLHIGKALYYRSYTPGNSQVFPVKTIIRNDISIVILSIVVGLMSVAMFKLDYDNQHIIKAFEVKTDVTNLNLKRQTENITQLNQVTAHLVQDMGGFKNKFINPSGIFAENAAGMHKEINALQANVNKLNNTTANISQQLTPIVNFTKNVASIRQEIAGLQVNVVDLTTATASISQDISGIKGLISDHSNLLADFKTRGDTQYTLLMKLTSNLLELDASHKHLSVDFNTYKADVNARNAMLDVAKKTLQSVRR